MPETGDIDLVKLRAFPQISPDAFQHPDDRHATEALEKIPAFPQLIRYIYGGVFETAWRLQHLSHCIRVGPRQARTLHRHFVRAAEILSIAEIPELFISPGSELNAYSIGLKKPAILLTRGLLNEMSLPEITAVIGHELGHVKCNHMANKTVASLIVNLGSAGISQLIPVLGGAALMALNAPLYQWSRKAELSCDRAALMVVQDPKIIAGTLAKLGGWPDSLGDIDFESLREQGEEYDALDNDAVAAAFKLLSMLSGGIYMTHPLPILRVKRILQWAESDQYLQILDGEYPRQNAPAAPNHCLECGVALAPGEKFCTRCGKEAALLSGEIVETCPNPACGWPLAKPHPRFCGKCGRDLREPGAG